MDAGVAGVIVGALGLVGAIASPILARRASWAEKGKAQAEAELVRQQAARIAFDIERDAAEEFHQLRLRADAAADEARLARRHLAEHVEAAERHEQWDQQIVQTVRAMRSALQQAGLGTEIPDPPDPPPLSLRS